jgi:hypothetical protein
LAEAVLPDQRSPPAWWQGGDSTSEDEDAGLSTSEGKGGSGLQYRRTDDGASLTGSRFEVPSPPPARVAGDETLEPDQVWGDSAIEALSGLEEYSEDDWDADGASAITSDLINLAANLLQHVPQNAALPDVAPAADGTVCMEWMTPSGLLWVDIGPDRTALILTRIAGKREEKRLPVDGKDFWSHFRTALEMLYPPKRVEDFRAFFEAV